MSIEERNYRELRKYRKFKGMEVKQLDIIMVNVAYAYEISKRRLEMDRYHRQLYKTNEVLPALYGDVELVHLVDSAVESLAPEYRQIILNDFFERISEKWYYKYYSKPTYYRMKFKAMVIFLNCLHI